MNLADLNNSLNNLDPNNIGSWPVIARVIVILILCGLILFGGYYFDTSNQLLELEKAENKETKLKQEFETKQAKAAALDAYKQQMQEIEQSFGALLQQLPSKTEVAAVLVDISRVGIQSGLEFELFKPGAEEPKEFYAELPISLRVTGDYHKFGNFVSGTAALPRIVTLHDLSITNSKGKDQLNVMRMEATAKTYRYLELEETAKSRDNDRKSRKKGKKGKKGGKK